MEITAIIDGKVKIVSQASIRRHLKLEDSDGISNLPTIEIFEQLALMGNMRRASKGYTEVDIPLFLTMLVQGPVVQGEGSTVSESVVPQPRSPTQTNVADEAASTGVDIRHGGAATTVTSLDARHGSGNIYKTPSMPHDSPLLKVHTLGSDEQTKKVYGAAFTNVTPLKSGCIRKMLVSKLLVKQDSEMSRELLRKIFMPRFERPDDEVFRRNPLRKNKGRKIAEIDQNPNISLVQHDAEVQGRHDMESDFEFTATEEVYTAKKGVSTAEPVSTVGASVSTTGASSSKDKGKAIMEEAETIQTKTKLQRIARVQTEASFFNIEEWHDIQARVEADEEFAQRLQTEEREMYSEA
ncbi:hypothetical protein Tco_0671542 [Tanacetum coccineum]